MYIISNFQDYYDSMAYAYGVDKSIVFKRNSDSEVNLDLRNIFSVELSRTVAHFIRSYYNINPYNNTTDNLLITPNDIYRIFQTITENKEYTVNINPELTKNIFWRNRFEELETNKKHIIETLYKHVSFPYFLLTPVSNYGYCKAIIPKLYELNFHTIMDAATCYQMVEMQVAKQIGNHDDKLIVISNNDRIKQHGFDLKKSFRKR